MKKQEIKYESVSLIESPTATQHRRLSFDPELQIGWSFVYDNKTYKVVHIIVEIEKATMEKDGPGIVNGPGLIRRLFYVLDLMSNFAGV
jgi:hypothetical protein